MGAKTSVGVWSLYLTYGKLPRVPSGNEHEILGGSSCRSRSSKLSRASCASPGTCRLQRFLGVGGSGRSPLESADPQVRRAERRGETKGGKYGLGGSERDSGRWGLGWSTMPLAQPGPLRFSRSSVLESLLLLQGSRWLHVRPPKRILGLQGSTPNTF